MDTRVEATKILEKIVTRFSQRMQKNELIILTSLHWEKITKGGLKGTYKRSDGGLRHAVFLLTKKRNKWHLNSLAGDIMPYEKTYYFAKKKDAKKKAIELLVRFSLAQE